MYVWSVVGIDDRHHLPALIDPEGPSWNGWVRPYFPMASILALGDELDREREDDPEGPWISIDGDAVTLHQREEEGGETVTYEPVTIDGTPVWPVGSCDWTWELTWYACGECGEEIHWHEVGEDLTRPSVDPVPVVLCKACAGGGA